MLYLYDDPVHALLSLFRRRYFFTQVMRLGLHLEPGCRRALRDYTPAQFVALGRDPLALATHVADWVRHACATLTPYPVVLARRSTLWQHIGELAGSVGLNMSLIPDREKRPYTAPLAHQQAEAALLTPDEHARLRATYSHVTDLLAAAGDFLVLNQSTCATAAVVDLFIAFSPYTCVLSPRHSDAFI